MLSCFPTGPLFYASSYFICDSRPVVFDSLQPQAHRCSPPGSSAHGIFLAKTLEWVAIPFSRGSSWPGDWTWVSCIACGFFTIWATRETQDSGVDNQTHFTNEALSEDGQIHFIHGNMRHLPKVTLPTSSKNSQTQTVCFQIVVDQSLSHIQLFATPWTVACQAPLSTGFFRQEYWSGLSGPPL